MANTLTGDYDAVVQIAIRQINGLLATLHQNGSSEAPALKLLHSARVRIGDLRPRPPGVEDFGDWVLEYQRARPPADVDDLRTQLTGSAPPGVARLMEDLFTRFDEAWIPPEPAQVVRGRAHVQLSTLALSVPESSSSEVTVHAHVRAHYYPDSDTAGMPAPIHGEVRAGFDVRRVQSPAGRRLLIQPSAQDGRIQFIAAPGSGLTTTDVSRISNQVRKALRERFTLLPVDLPPDFPFADFKGVGSPPAEAVALPLHLSGGAPPASIQSITQSFIGTSGFAFAVSREYVLGLIDIEAIRQAIATRRITFRVSVLGFSGRVTYSLRFTSGPTVTFRPGAIDIEGQVAVETGTWWAPNGWVKFKQAIGLVLDPATQTIGLQRAGEPDVDESLFIPHGVAVNAVRSEMDNALSSNGAAVRRVFRDAKSDLLEGLTTFDASASATYTSVEIAPDGVIVRGEIGGAPRLPPVVDVAETHAGAAFTAFESWIPGGRIDRFIWSWIEYSDLHPSPWAGVEKSFTDDHRFIFPRPDGVGSVEQVCLRIEGTQIGPNGHVASIAGGTTCRVPEPTIGLDVPSWWEPVTLPVWLPDVAEDAVLKDAIAGHVSIPTPIPPRDGLAQNSIVYFADWASDEALDPLARAFARMRRRSVSLLTIVVVPPGAFDGRRGELERRLAVRGDRLRTRLQLTEDHDGGWSRTFGASHVPSAYLIDARRRFVWKQEGTVDPGALAAALDDHLVPAPAPHPPPLRLAVSAGDRAPDSAFIDVTGQRHALHRFRGRSMLLNFWQSWSGPCLEELQRLQRLADRTRKAAPVIVAFHGGKDDTAPDRVRRELGLSFALVQDLEQRIARTYGVRCWPTTVSVDAEGRVDHVQFGIARPRGEGAGRGAAAGS